MRDPAQEIADLLADYPELGTGLDEFMTTGNDPLVSMAGILVLLKLRVRNVLALLPQPAPPDDAPPGGR
jgi:hypothetical protein